MSKRAKHPHQRLVDDLAVAGYAVTRLGCLINNKRKQMDEVHACRAGLIAVFRIAEVLGGEPMMDEVKDAMHVLEIGC